MDATALTLARDHNLPITVFNVNTKDAIRTGRANPAILDDIKVDYYGNLTVLNQTASISVEDGRSLVISPWDKSLIPEIEKAISNSNF